MLGLTLTDDLGHRHHGTRQILLSNGGNLWVMGKDREETGSIGGVNIWKGFFGGGDKKGPRGIGIRDPMQMTEGLGKQQSER